MQSYNQEIKNISVKGVSLFLKREDLLDPEISGNKYRKLKYNLIKAKSEGFTVLLTFGGAFSNHIAAVAAAGKKYGFETIGVIRGEELADKISDNPTLLSAKQNGMKFVFVSREVFREKDAPEFIGKLRLEYGDFYLLPEGGTNDLAVKGCEEILTADDAEFTHVCCAVGTGGTLSGIINSSGENQKVIGFPSLKGSFLSDDIRSFVKTKNNWELITEYHFGGYGKISEELILFLNGFYQETGVSLDPVYTGKMMFGIYDLIEKGYFPEGSKILAVHTGGLQGCKGMNLLLKKKQLPLLNYI
ncbi:1-aminocyclopropane-1-carboxylate deaminase [Flavobacterium limnosediminis JC2902]|uniref:1-aminocyclopropane-1-carboxylate deaminase n=1 Tax=Flavobacterium limnosediminis JC2902 TaxID=1341181 RepID=V6SY26_9FLAO|nr:pyridoxal-phosphate dependent enzyme [Flavobacterium limnosediminis]ESU29305.1 1-aminocyclopropane-1-carboxylate deaminase [Flavobacterium limnosediminis JC2902]